MKAAEGLPIVFTAQSKRHFYCREAVCQFAFSRGAVPINPFMAFGYFLAERPGREAVRHANDALLLRADALWVFGRELSNGVLAEISLAADHGKPIRFFSVDDLPEKIAELHMDDLRFEDEVLRRTGQTRKRLLEDLRALLESPSAEHRLALDL
jgi:hypothetical protein